MKQILTKGIVLSRTDYGEADRILTVLTPEKGKLRLMARGVRRSKSKLAGSIELFSTTDITYIEGKGEIGTLISARLIRHYGRIVQSLDRVQLGYELIKMLNRATEDHPEPEYYDLLEQAFAALDDQTIDVGLTSLWFESALVRLAGYTPNLQTDTKGNKLSAGQIYEFDFEAMALAPHKTGRFTASHVKTLRLLFSGHTPHELVKVQGLIDLLPDLSPLVRAMLTSHIRI